MRKAHDSYMSGVERDAKQREAERRAEADRLRRNEVWPSLLTLTKTWHTSPDYGNDICPSDLTVYEQSCRLCSSSLKTDLQQWQMIGSCLRPLLAGCHCCLPQCRGLQTAVQTRS